MIRKSGAREWDDPETMAAIVATAKTATEAIYVVEPLPEESVSMSGEMYVKTGTEVVFGSEVGDDVAWSSESIADGAGRQSALYDQGADGTARPEWWRYRFFSQAQATPTARNAMETAVYTSDGSHPDSGVGTSDAAISYQDDMANMKPCLPVVVHSAAANTEYARSGRIAIAERYFGVALWNGMGSAITTDAAETKAIFTQVYVQSQ